MINKLNSALADPILIARKIDLFRLKTFLILIIYIILSIFQSFIDGFAFVVLTGLILNDFNIYELNSIPLFIKEIVFPIFNFENLNQTFFFLLILFSLSFFLRIIILGTDGVIHALLRKIVQNEIINKQFYGLWSETSHSRVGEIVGTINSETLAVVKLFTSILNIIYYFFASLTVAFLCLLIFPYFSLIIGLLALPIFLGVSFLFYKLANISKLHAYVRNNFVADITETLNGLFQSQTTESKTFYINKSIKNQNQMTYLEIITGFYQAITGSFNIMMPLYFILVISITVYFLNFSIVIYIEAILSIGILGIRFFNYFNNLISGFGNIFRLSGSLVPVKKYLNTIQKNKKSKIKNPIIKIKIEDIAFNLNKSLFNFKSFSINKNDPIIICGRSGAGKTTLANLIAGIYNPSSGKISYIDNKNNQYSSSIFFANIGYVTQNIYLYNGTIKENLCLGKEINDSLIYETLKMTDSIDFVKEMGGLNAKVLEAGKSLSGGQIRRLGISRELLKNPDIYIFDEIIAGLDEINKREITKIINVIRKNKIVIIISHEKINFENFKIYEIK